MVEEGSIESKVCSICNTEKSIDQFQYQRTKGNYRASCTPCKNITNRNQKWKKLGFNSPEEGLAFNESKYIKNNKYPGIYLLWLGEKNKYYVGSSEHYLRRRGAWRYNVTVNWEKFLKENGTNEQLFNIYQKTQFYSIKLLEKLPLNITNQSMYLKEKEWMIKVILKHKTIYNKLA